MINLSFSMTARGAVQFALIQIHSSLQVTFDNVEPHGRAQDHIFSYFSKEIRNKDWENYNIVLLVFQ